MIHSISQDRIFSVTDSTFNALAIEIFRHQFKYNVVYKQFVDLMGIIPSKVIHLSEIPFLPIEVFKSHKVVTGVFDESLVFESSSTTGIGVSRHYILDEDLCKHSFLESFKMFYGPPENYVFLALLPGYVERKNASLVYMVQSLLEAAGNSEESFFSTDFNLIKDNLKKYIGTKKKVIVIGVTWSLIDFAEQRSMRLSDNIIVMETGGMKGRKKELTRNEIHEILKKAFGVSKIHSEYGMTELLSVSYSLGNGIFRCPPWMKVFVGDTTDPLKNEETGETGNLKVIDMANLNSCSFIATSDLGRLLPDRTFEVLGRTDMSDARGCSLMMA